jgi:hypothetical protein
MIARATMKIRRRKRIDSPCLRPRIAAGFPAAV